jgi:hypothetical protein
MGSQFEERTVEQQALVLRGLLDTFEKEHPHSAGAIQVATSIPERDDCRFWFDVST